MRENMLRLLLSHILLILNGVCSTLAATTPAADTYTILNGSNITKPNCPRKCGNLTVPFPFGIGSGCGLSDAFELNCTDGRGRLSLSGLLVYQSIDRDGAITAGADVSGPGTAVFEISDGRVRVANLLLMSKCYNGTALLNVTGAAAADLTGTPFSFSELNTVTVVSCDDYGSASSGASSGFGSNCA